MPATAAASRRASTPWRLRRLLVLILGATAVLWITATILVQGQRGTVASVRGGSSPAWLDAVEAHAALSDADRAAWQSFRSGEAQLTGPGQQYQNDITTASQDLERLAALEPAGGPGSEQIQTISGQLVTYQGLVEQADAANRADIALGAASNHDLGYAYLTYASSSMRDPQGGLLASIDQLASLDRRALGQDAAAGTLAPIDGALDPRSMASQYGPGWLTLMQAAGPRGARHYYAIIVKAALKSVIWYDPRQFPARYLGVLTSPGLTWNQLMSMTARLRAAGTPPWCIGMEDSSSSGWPGTDWIEDIVLHQSGPQVYDRWVAGALPWTSAPIARAWQTFGQIAGAPGVVRGGTQAELVTSYGVAGQPMFTSPPGCYLDHEASFITGFYAQDRLGTSAAAHPRPEADFDFVPFPAATAAGRGSAEVAADLLGMFRDTPAARKLIAYLTRPQAQEAWIRRPGSGAISVNRLVPLGDYPDPVSRGLARDLITARSVRFDASDSMPQVMDSAFNNAVLEYLDSPGQLQVILRGLDEVRKAAY